MSRSGCTWDQVMQYAKDRAEERRRNNAMMLGRSMRGINAIELLVVDLKRIYQIR